jgi:uncharacterized protein YdaU (DUF1376 family)
MADFPALPLWTDAFLADTTHLDATETGAYMLLLMTAWRRPNNDLPDDDVQLRRFARTPPVKWRKIKPRVMIFWELKNGVWRQKRLDKERNRVKKNSEKKRTAAHTRWAKPLETNKPASASASSVHASRISNHIQNHIQESQETLSFALEGAKDDGWPNDYRDVFWKAYPHKVGKKPALAKLDRCRKRGVAWAELIGGVERYLREKPPHQSWLNPETFFNQERWADQRAPEGDKQNGKNNQNRSAIDAWDRLREKATGDDSDEGEDAILILPPRPVQRS